ncbi:MAG TPA: hypothetical protein VH478_14285 [Trebonia sp.]|nr:hypothetical protein [Trebonia sp.]
MAGQQGAALVAVPDWTAARPGGRLAGDPPAGHPAGALSRPDAQRQPG